MILMQANFGRGVSVAEFVDNLDRVLDAGGKRAVFAFQEIDEADKPALYALATGTLGAEYADLNGPARGLVSRWAQRLGDGPTLDVRGLDERPTSNGRLELWDLSEPVATFVCSCPPEEAQP